jgi:N-acetylmuramoyl-L-alanine amidase-like protein
VVAPKLAVALAAFALAAALACALASAAGAWSPPAAAGPVAKGVPEPKVDFDPIPYDRSRKHQMAAYSKRHYGERTWRLTDPQAIVLHYTATSTYGPVFNTFASNAPNLGESPGVCSQFVVEEDGTIHQLTRLDVRCRHTVGLNHVAIGVEMVQEDLGSRHGAEQAILDRGDQSRAAVRLVAWLKQRYGVSMKNVIGHAMANDSPLFEDREGWQNDHVDWRAADVRDFRARVAGVIRDHR